MDSLLLPLRIPLPTAAEEVGDGGIAVTSIAGVGPTVTVYLIHRCHVVIPKPVGADLFGRPAAIQPNT